MSFIFIYLNFNAFREKNYWLAVNKLNSQYYFTRKKSYYRIKQLFYKIENLSPAVNALNGQYNFSNKRSHRL